MRTKQQGFTLLELLVSVAITGLLLAALLTGLHVAAQARERGNQRLQEIRRKEERLSFLSRQISSLVPYRIVSPDPQTPLQLAVLEATATRLRFLSTYGSDWRNHSELLLAEYALLEAPSGKFRLVLRETPVRSDEFLWRQLVQRVARDLESGQLRVVYRPFPSEKTEGEEPLVLWSDLESPRFEYLDLHEEALEWLPEWAGDHDASYPAAVRLRWQRGGSLEEQVFPVPARFPAP